MDVLKQRIPSSLYDKLLQADIDSLKTILIKSELALCQLTKLSLKEVKYVVQEACDIILKVKFKTACEIPEWSHISTGCDTIDFIIRGGIPVNGITEIMGASGVGKTQLCLQLALTVQFPINLGGLNKGAVYICTEDVFPSKRLNQLAKRFPLQFMDLNKLQFEDNIFIEHISDYEQLRRCLYVQLPKLLLHRSIGIIIIDSIAGIFRSENISVNYTSRSQEFLTIASQLSKLGNTYGIAIVCVNQVTDNTETGKSEACLGLAWSNLVTCRFSISRYIDAVRLFDVVVAPDLPNISCKFIIKDFGLTGIK